MDRIDVVLDHQEPSVDRYEQCDANNPQSPNDDRFPLIQTWDWEARGNVTYHLPFGLFTSASYRAQSGGAGQRTQVFTSPALRQGSVTLRMGEFGDLRAPSIQIVNLKVAKNVGLGAEPETRADLPGVQRPQQQRHHRRPATSPARNSDR